MKIALTHMDLPNESKGGVAHQVHELANHLVGRGHDVTMFTYSPAWEECAYAIHQYSSPPGRLRRARLLLFAFALARTDFSAFDVLHTNGDNYLVRGGSGRRRLPPQLRTFYGSARDEAQAAVRLRRRIHQGILSYLENLDARVADKCVGISRTTQERQPAVSEIVPCGVDVARFRPGAKSEKPSILFVGTAAGRKRGQFLADIFTRVIRPAVPDAELWAVADQPLQGEGIVNHGRISEEVKADLFQRAWTFCLPSTYEGFGVPYIEAMASGTAVVASPNPGAREVLRDGAFGLLADDEKLGEALIGLLGDPAARDQWAAKGLTRSQDFSWERVAARYEALYEELIAARRSAATAKIAPGSTRSNSQAA